MNIIELLKQQVTAKVLQGDNQYQDEKIGALYTFFPILLTILKSKPELITTLQQNLNPRITDVFSQHPETVNNFLGLVSGDAPKEDIEKTLNHAIAPTLTLLADQAGSDDKNAIFDLIKAQWGNIENALPTWAKGLFNTLGLNVGGLSDGGLGIAAGLGAVGAGVAAAATQVGSAVKDTAHDVVTKVGATVEEVLHKPTETVSHVASSVKDTAHNAINEVEKKSNWLLPIIALLVLAGLAALLFKQCSSKPPVAADASGATSQAMAELQAAELHLTTDATGALSTVSALSSSDSVLDKLKASIGKVFGQSDALKDTANASYAADLPDLNSVEQVLAKIKGLPHVSLAWVGNQLSIQSPDLAQAQKLADELKGLLPNVQITATQSVADASVAGTNGAEVNVNARNSQADQALTSIQVNKANINDVVSALNLQVINFATGSAGIPADNKAILDKAATLLKQLPEAKIVVNGFTDNAGNPDSNQALSEKRAKSVVTYLIGKGVGAGQLTAAGHGQDNPIADNTTKEGQFKNRRIEFAVAP